MNNENIIDIIGYSINIDSNNSSPKDDPFQQFISELVSYNIKNHSKEMFELFNNIIGNYEVSLIGESLNIRIIHPVLYNSKSIHEKYMDGINDIISMFKLFINNQNISQFNIDIKRQLLVNENIIFPSKELL